MDTLRWILLGLGIVVVLAIWAGARFKTDRRGRRTVPDLERIETGDMDIGIDTANARRDPDAGELRDDLDELHELLREEAAERPSEPRQSAASEDADTDENMIVVLHVMARQPGHFGGLDLLRAFRDLRLEHGAMNIFHRMTETDAGEESLFSIANMLNPGTFDPDRMDDFETPGVAFFLQLPAAIDGVDAYEEMLECAVRLAQKLDGLVLDSARQLATPQGNAETRERIRRFETSAY
ncbi:MAG: cell division protein ZipA [Chromatiales bacterium]|nr:cell division protein ZipA [Chromatiales bacterium]